MDVDGSLSHCFGMAATQLLEWPKLKKIKPPPLAPLPMPAQHQGPGGIPPTANSGWMKKPCCSGKTPKNAWENLPKVYTDPQKTSKESEKKTPSWKKGETSTNYQFLGSMLGFWG